MSLSPHCDGWTLRSATGCRTAHSEHTVLVTADGGCGWLKNQDLGSAQVTDIAFEGDDTHLLALGR